ncbi:MAG: PDZ domain-containing protein [Pyrinomonadaceae bacterium]
MRINKTISLFTSVLVCGLAWFQIGAQTPSSPQPMGAHEGRKPIASTRVNPVIVQIGAPAPQVVTILHRLNGLKVFRLLLRSSEQFGSIAKLDEAFQIAGDVHTNVVAGLTLDDGQTIAAWLPEAEAEMPPPAFPFSPKAPAPPKAPSSGARAAKAATVSEMSAAFPGFHSGPLAGNLLGPADLKIITRDGKRLLGRYLGLDGLTGLSVITLANSSFPKVVDAKDQLISVGQRLRLVGPEPASHSEPSTRTAMYVRIGETRVTVASVSRSPSGVVARVNIQSANLTPANIGAIALNESGETIGIVDAVEGSEATIVPVAVVRSAVKRVIARQASVPRPWLGVRGEPVRSLSLERMLGVGWEPERARALAEKREGIMLTSVAPGSPAAQGRLCPGDVILTVNKEAVRNADDFSWLLQEAEPGSSVHFDVARLGKLGFEAFEIKLSESPDPFFGWRTFETPKALAPGSLMAQGIETIAIKPRVALPRFGANGGLLVVYVQPATPAFKAGLLPGDVIEAIDGQKLFPASRSVTLLSKPGASSIFYIVRNKQKMTLKVPAK